MKKIIGLIFVLFIVKYTNAQSYWNSSSARVKVPILQGNYNPNDSIPKDYRDCALYQDTTTGRLWRLNTAKDLFEVISTTEVQSIIFEESYSNVAITSPFVKVRTNGYTPNTVRLPSSGNYTNAEIVIYRDLTNSAESFLVGEQGSAQIEGENRALADNFTFGVDIYVACFAYIEGVWRVKYVYRNTSASSAPTDLSLDDITAEGTINILNSNGTGVSIPLATSIGSGLIGASNFNKLTDLSTSRQLPIGGTTGQVLGKITNTDYAVGWIENVVDGSVSFAKMANISNNTLIGRFTAGTGSPESIGIGSGLSNTGTTLYNTLAVGLGSNQTVIGGFNASGTLTLRSTANATRGNILFGTSAYDEVNNRLGIVQTSPLSRLHINANQNSVTQNDANGILLANSTAAISGTQSISPPLVIQGNGYQTGTNGSQDVRFRMDVLPVQSTGASPTGQFRLSSSVNSGAYANALTYTTGGILECYAMSGSQMILAQSQLVSSALSPTSFAGATFNYSTRNSGGTTVTPRIFLGSSTGTSSGEKTYGIDPTNGIVFIAGNASGNRVARASIDLSTSQNNAGNEMGSIIFRTQNSGADMATRLTIGPDRITSSICLNSNTQLIQSSQSVAQLDYNTITGGINVIPSVIAANNSNTAGDKGIALDNSNGLVFMQVPSGSAIRRTSYAAINGVPTSNTASSESGDLAFLVQNGGTAMAEAMRIRGTAAGGYLGLGTTVPTSKLQINYNQGISSYVEGAGFRLENNTAATSGTQPAAPPIVFSSNGWSTGSTASQSVKILMGLSPASGSTNPSGNLQIQSSINGAGYSTIFTFNSSGNFTLNNSSGWISAGNSALGYGGGQVKIEDSAVSSASYKTTNGNPATNPPIWVGNTGLTSGSKALIWDSSNQLSFLAKTNNSTFVARASISIDNLGNTAGSESGDLIFDTQSGGTAMSEKLRISGTGDFTFFDGGSFILGTTTGTKIGTNASQKLAFWNATPIGQPTTSVGSAVISSAGAGNTIKTDDTFDGYTIQQVVKALRNLGLLQ